MFESEEQFGAVLEQQLHIRTGEVDGDLWIFHFRVRILGRFHLEAQFKAGVGENRLEKLLQLGT
jgi:hypothetical protein